MNRSTFSKATWRRVMFVVVGVLCLGVQAWAAGSRCINCGFCSSSDFACGLCIVEAVRANCGTYTPGAYGTCLDGEWTMHCDGGGGQEEQD